jgi:hypothetical protein
MLGSTDESHIIRTIEYWDIESRKNPSKEHRAVIIAETITTRFFNVIYLMNRAIPIVAIQLDALKLGDDLILHFTKVLDVYETPEDTIALAAEPTNRAYWESLANPKSMASIDAVIGLCKEIYPELKVTFNKGHIALGTQRQQFCWLHARKKQAQCYAYLSVGEDNKERAGNLLAQAAVPFTILESVDLSLPISATDIEQKREAFTQLFQLAVSEYK